MYCGAQPKARMPRVQSKARGLDITYNSCELEAFAKGSGGAVEEYPTGDYTL